MSADNTEIRFTVIAKEELVSDIKFIAAFERKKQKELWDGILSSFIEDWKEKNPGVKFPNK